jgi:HEAT repeat protein
LTGSNTESELIAQLSSDKRSVRIQAIVKLTRAGQTEHSLRALIPYINSSDRETSFFATQAAGKIAQKAGLDLSAFLEKSAKPDVNSGQQITAETFLSPLKEKIPELLELIRANADAIPANAMPAVGVFLSRHGDLSDAPFIEQQLLKDNSNLALPFMNAAETVAGVILPRVLPGLLASREPLVRSRAVSVLRRIDPEEAERHFSDLLASRDPEDRLAGIGIALLFPFDRVKGYLLSILPEEQDQEVLDACQTVLASNPEVDTALSVLDSIDSVGAGQKGRLSKIFKAICHAIGIAEVLPQDKAAPESLIKLWKQQRLQNFLYDLEIQLAFAEETRKKAIIDWIKKNRQHPKVGELIERLGKNPQTEEIFKQLKAATAKAESAPEATLPGTPQNDTEKLAILKCLEIDTFAQNRTWIIEEATGGNAEVRAEALNALLRIKPEDGLKELGKNALLAEDHEVKISGFKILERFDPNFLKDKVSDLLLNNDPNLRLRAIRFGLKFEEKASIEALKKIITSPEPNVRSNAVGCLAICPFHLVFKILMDQLDREDHPVIARQIANILLSNPSKSVLKALDNITRTSNPAVAMVISQTRNDLFEIVSDMPGQQESEATEKKSEVAEKPYSVSNVREIARRNQNWKPSYKAAQKTEPAPRKMEINWQMLISGSVILIFLGMLPIMLLSEKKASERPKSVATQDQRVSERVKPIDTKIPVKFRMNRACSLTGTVEKIISDTSLVMVHEGSQLMVKFETPEIKPFNQGDLIKVTLVPYRVNPNGIILSRGQKIEPAKD